MYYYINGSTRSSSSTRCTDHFTDFVWFRYTLITNSRISYLHYKNLLRTTTSRKISLFWRVFVLCWASPETPLVLFCSTVRTDQTSASNILHPSSPGNSSTGSLEHLKRRPRTSPAQASEHFQQFQQFRLFSERVFRPTFGNHVSFPRSAHLLRKSISPYAEDLSCKTMAIVRDMNCSC